MRLAHPARGECDIMVQHSALIHSRSLELALSGEVIHGGDFPCFEKQSPLFSSLPRLVGQSLLLRLMLPPVDVAAAGEDMAAAGEDMAAAGGGAAVAGSVGVTAGGSAGGMGAGLGGGIGVGLAGGGFVGGG